MLVSRGVPVPHLLDLVAKRAHLDEPQPGRAIDPSSLVSQDLALPD